MCAAKRINYRFFMFVGVRLERNKDLTRNDGVSASLHNNKKRKHTTQRKYTGYAGTDLTLEYLLRTCVQGHQRGRLAPLHGRDFLPQFLLFQLSPGIL